MKTRTSNASKRALQFILLFAIIVVGDIISGGLAISSTSSAVVPVPPNTCTSSNQLCDQIVFDQSVFGNSSVSAPVITSTMWTATLNETLVVVADSNIGGSITGITDTALDSYTKIMSLSLNCLPCQNFEIWAAKYKGLTGTLSTVTVTWNATTNNVFVMSSYLNVAGIGNSTGTNFNGNTGTINIMPAFSGSKIVGGIGISPASGEACNSAVAGTFLTQRVDSCSRAIAIPEVEVASADNMTVLRNTQNFAYQYSTNDVITTAIQIGAIELIGFDKEPSFPNFNNFCTTTNGLCVTSQYSINAVNKASGANALNQVLALNTVYCTGITTMPLTVSAPHEIIGWGTYGAVSLNQTGAKLLVQFKIGTTAPSTVFGAGVCASGGIVVGTASIYFAISGSLSATNAFSTAINFVAQAVASTQYGWFEITPQNFAGHINYDQVFNQPYSQASIGMMEIK